MSNYPICKTCGAKMTEYDECSWYTCPECGQAIRDNGDGSWTWKDEIYDENGNVVKKDIFTIKHNKRTNQITGHVKRVFPNEQTHRKWKCSGVITDNHFILSFWSNDLIMSDGCVYTVLVDDYTYEGYYLRGTKDQIYKIKIRLTKEVKT